MEDVVSMAEDEFHEETRNETDLEVLHPENPLMIRFQKALKQQLENKLKTITDDIVQTVRFRFI